MLGKNHHNTIRKGYLMTGDSHGLATKMSPLILFPAYSRKWFINYDYNTGQKIIKQTFISMLPRFSNLKPPTSSKYCLVFSDT